MTTGGVRTALRLAGAAALLLIQTAWWLHPVPLAAKAIGMAFLGLGLANPPAALLAFAGLAPFTTVLASLTGADYGGPWLLEQMALACIIGGLLGRGAGTRPATALGWPAAMAAVVAMASAATLLPTRALELGPEAGSTAVLIRGFFEGGFGRSDPFWAPVFAGLAVLEGGLLGWTVERAVRRDAGLGRRLLVMALIAAAGASLLGLYRITAAAIASGDFWLRFPPLLARARVNMQTDVNAAASTLVLALVAGVGLAAGGRRRWLGIIALIAMTGLGVWITGSRAALVAVLIGTACAAGWLATRRGGMARLVAAGGVLLMFIAGGVLIAAYPRGRNPTVEHSIDSRLILIRAGVDMFRSAPVFGIGVAQFLDRSKAVSAALQTYGPVRENAHNNFIQVLAEQGLAGFAALILLLAVVFVGVIRAELADPDWSRLWLAIAVLTSTLTWLTGHPLLVPEYALVFWMFVGVLAGTCALPGWQPGRAGLLVLALIIVSVPFRAVGVRDQAELEHRGFDLSGWRHDDEQRYREGASRFSIFLPTADRPNVVPLRRAPGQTGPLSVEFRCRGRVVATASLTNDAWQAIAIDLPTSARRFEQIDVVVLPAESGTAARVRVGRASLLP